MERTTVTLPKKLVREVVKTTQEKGQTRAVVVALEEVVRSHKILEIKKMAGRLKFDSGAARRRRRDKRLG